MTISTLQTEIDFARKVTNEATIWKSIPGYEGLYEAGSNGHIRSVDRVVIDCLGLAHTYKGRILAQDIKDDGYRRVCLSKNGKCIAHSVHRLVALAFIPNPENKETVNHINCDKEDNRPDNLEWATRGEQVNHAYAHKLIPCRMTEESILEIKRMYQEVKNVKRCATAFGLSWHMAKYYIIKDTPIGYRATAAVFVKNTDFKE
jgi:hypothetical protein